MHLPRVAVAWEGGFERAPRRNDVHLREILLDSWHAEGRRVLHPALGSIRDNEHLAYFARLDEQRLYNPLECGQLLSNLRGDRTVLSLHHF
eukprot:CAMPEP_0181215424 /NCGR_PEP_ID=MMETSP1096-20121128/26010_1 /TAXON_ID=156174 ORGANISM="Chrysochromulina ericina, Strain CCMP281" /NCGR_SAMPLE_ID=MMETSP1096 /ASSEMBLY_ACC=CAM_ASM_000453 /LENGTH=90 /DNA_ID=CAMNT_0023307287 /DNA_START=848 /DNA_END=1120 /DNA_ORIENTATION=-